MLIIPVIDVRGGVVVAARGGDRDNYRPIETPLAPESSDPVAVVKGYRALHRFPIVYMADLDGIAGRAANSSVVGRLAREFPEVEVWIDHGANSPGAVEAMLALSPNAVVVVGSETLGDGSGLGRITAAHGARTALSLDFKGATFLGPEGLDGQPDSWPGRVIVMTLAAVGSDAGPDLARLARVRGMARPGSRIFAAGGVRHLADCRTLAMAGAAGVLVASALHGGKLKAGDLEEIAGL